MSGTFYPAYTPSWFQSYGYQPSAYWRNGDWYYSLLGSNQGQKETFRQYVFRQIGAQTTVIDVSPAIPVIHGTLVEAAGTLWLFGLSEKLWLWQPVVMFSQSMVASLLSKPVAPSIDVARHDRMPVVHRAEWDRLWKVVNA